MNDPVPVHPADAEVRPAQPVVREAPREHTPTEQVQPPNADAQDLYGPPSGQ